jgi:hypothetical protein
MSDKVTNEVHNFTTCFGLIGYIQETIQALLKFYIMFYSENGNAN